MKKAAFFLVLIFLGLAIHAAPAGADFSRAIAYYLIGDIDLARKNMEAHFNRQPQPAVKLGFSLLFQDKKWEATKKFNDYLESNRRSFEALTGISLATADIGNSLAIDNLGRILRLNPAFAPAHLCLGNEYSLRGNFPAAEMHFNKSLKTAAIPEFKILLAGLYLKTNRAQKALDLIRPEAEASPRNYHYAFWAAKSALESGDLAAASHYIDQAQNARPESKETQLLRGRLLLASGDLRRAKALLGKLKFANYHPEYSLVFAEVLVRSRDAQAEKYLYEAFAQNQWHPGVNKLMGLFHLKGKKANVQNWINRALLSGLPAAELQEEFPAQYSFADFPFFAIFAAKKIQWLGNGRVLVAGALNSGESEKLMVIDADTMKVLKSFAYQGTIQEMFPAPKLDKVVFSTTAVENEKVYVYTLIADKNSYRLKPLVGYALNMATVMAGFSQEGATAYIVDGNLSELAFASPFSTVATFGRRQALYPDHPIAVFSYTYANERWNQIKSRQAMRSVPLPVVRRYLAVADACRENSEVAKLLEKGSRLDLTSAEEMKIHFGAAADSFLISFSDLKNAFQAWVYDPRVARLIRFDETMFLGKKYYAELDLLSFNPGKSEILVTTRDKQRNLIHFNYRSLLYEKLGSNVLTAGIGADGSTVYALNERSRQLYYSDTNLEIIQLSPFSRDKIDSRRDLNAIVDCSDRSEQYFTTYNGELLKLDADGKFSSRQVALAGTLHQVSPDKKKAAVFINGRLFVLPWQE